MSKDVLIETRARIGHITLNRPDALHALNTGMCRDMLSALKGWSSDTDIELVLIDHAEGSRGFCAGGDIRMLARSGAADGAEARAFFADEYRLNTAIHNFPKPFVALMDGVTMGGGVGLSVHGSHRIATERTLFAMPETGIGLFPDVGGGWFLPRLEGELGTWLALTGARLKGTDVVAAGVASHFVPSGSVADLRSDLINASSPSEELDGILAKYVEPVDVGSFAQHADTINSCFAHDRAEDILEALQGNGSEWAREQAGLLKTKSPRTVKVALRQLREGRAFDLFEDNMINEYRIGCRQVASTDFIEGVRAVIIDKDHDPKWDPSSLEAISDETVDGVFAPLPDGEELSF
ncbi:MAG: enoyl-CoA hydratase/isomerase family protein [Pseudomonadota bacterium]